MTDPTTVGRFTYNPATGQITGPADYMRDHGLDRIDRIERGADPAFGRIAEHAPDIATAILLTLQTDYAAYRGANEFHQRRARGVRPDG